MDRLNKKDGIRNADCDQRLSFRLTGFIGLALTLWIAFVCSWTSPAIAASLIPEEQVVSVSFNNQEESAMFTEQNREIALQFAQEGWGTNPNWRRVWDKLMTNDVVYHFNSSAEPIIGLEANKEFNADLFQGFPKLHQTIEDLLVEGDKVVYRTTLQGKNTGNFLGTLPTDKPVKINSFTQLQLSDGQITEWWYECNLLEVMKQLGLISDMAA